MAQPAPTPIAGASTKQEDGESMSSILMAPLNDLQSLAHTLFLSLSPPQTRPPRAPPLSAFLDCDTALAAAVNLAHVHQVKQRRIESLEAELVDLEGRWRDICRELATGKKELEAIIEEGDERIKGIHAAKEAAIPYPELLAYAQKLAMFTSAPPNMPDGPLQGQQSMEIFPPFPNETNMRMGRLNQEEPLGQLGETHSVKKAPTPTPMPEPNTKIQAPGLNPYRHEFREPQTQFFDLDLDLNPDLDDE